MSALQTQGGLQQSNELLKVPAVLVEADQVLQLVCMDHYVKATDLCQAKFLTLHTCKTYLGAGEKDKRITKVERKRLDKVIHAKLLDNNIH